MAPPLSTNRKEPVMAASEMAYGEDHPATSAVQPAKPQRAQLSGEAFGEGEEHSFRVEAPPEHQFFHHGHDSDD